MNSQFTNDFFHKYLLKVILPLALRNRDVINGNETEERIVCISFDCDVREDMERVPLLLDALRGKNVRSSFALTGNLANEYPIIVREIVEKGHEILNHSFSHPQDFHSIRVDSMKREIESFQRLMINRFGYASKGFRAPHLMRRYNRILFQILRQNELYDSSYIGRGFSIINGLIELPLTSCPDHRQVCFDYWHHFQFPLVKSSFRKFLNLWENLLGKEHFINVYLDPYLTADAFLKEMIERVPDSFRFSQLKDVANRVKRHVLSKTSGQRFPP